MADESIPQMEDFNLAEIKKFIDTFGLANLKKVPLKKLTAVGVWDLVDKGILRLDTDLGLVYGPQDALGGLPIVEASGTSILAQLNKQMNKPGTGTIYNATNTAAYSELIGTGYWLIHGFANMLNGANVVQISNTNSDAGQFYYKSLAAYESIIPAWTMQAMTGPVYVKVSNAAGVRFLCSEVSFP